ncbi:MAG: 3-deoxy-7-phosphoheptulonate synthase [Thermoleophilia bacterium]|nr:3-deoxy-7-phosphoheptulonate synthase [Thermoleophilia bacterium]
MGEFLVIAGPCSVEGRDQLLEVAHGVADAGASMLRGGAFKPRTSPHSFRGLGADGLALLREARELTGLPVVTEVLDPRDIEAVADAADMIQIGARNMSNGALLREVASLSAGRPIPILLKRGFGASIDEWLDAADYLLSGGNDQVVLCERGIRTFETSTRFTLDLSAVPVLRTRTHLPIIVDPSHAAGDARYVTALARAAAAAGADGVMVEVHADPANALSDGAQSLQLSDFSTFIAELDTIVTAMKAHRSLPSKPVHHVSTP